VRRLRWEWSALSGFEDVRLPWGISIRVRPNETIGSCIGRLGVYDLCLSECIWRLLDPRERAVDVGANIGYMTGLMAVRTGSGGTVYAFEPHPEVFEELSDNVTKWQELDEIASFSLFSLALGDEAGRALLDVPDAFKSNRGVATLRQKNRGAMVSSSALPVRVEKLDDVLQAEERIGILKIDVEGHELAVLQGAEGLVERGFVRDILYEEHNSSASRTTVWLESRGYSVYYLDQLLLGVKAVPYHLNYRPRGRREAPNLLATREPERALERLSPRGWRVLRAKRSVLHGKP
jgi:FkbM family methyltransferase